MAEIHQLGATWHLSQVFPLFSGFAATQSQPERAVRLAGATAVLGEVYHTPPIPMAEAVLAEGLERARRELDGAAYATAWEHGRRMSLDESIAEALAVEIHPISPPRHRREIRADAVPAGLQAEPPKKRAQHAQLTPTEVKVLRQLASGRTTREIAEALVVATSTVDRHLTHIYTKLGVRNRAAATSFAVKHGLV